MRITKVTSMGLPWTSIAAEEISTAFLCQVDLYDRLPHALFVFAEVTEEQLKTVIRDGASYRVSIVDLDENLPTPAA